MLNCQSMVGHMWWILIQGVRELSIFMMGQLRGSVPAWKCMPWVKNPLYAPAIQPWMPMVERLLMDTQGWRSDEPTQGLLAMLLTSGRPACFQLYVLDQVGQRMGQWSLPSGNSAAQAALLAENPGWRDKLTQMSKYILPHPGANCPEVFYTLWVSTPMAS